MINTTRNILEKAWAIDALANLGGFLLTWWSLKPELVVRMSPVWCSKIHISWHILHLLFAINYKFAICLVSNITAWKPTCINHRRIFYKINEPESFVRKQPKHDFLICRRKKAASELYLKTLTGGLDHEPDGILLADKSKAPIKIQEHEPNSISSRTWFALLITPRSSCSFIGYHSLEFLLLHKVQSVMTKPAKKNFSSKSLAQFKNQIFKYYRQVKKRYGKSFLR